MILGLKCHIIREFGPVSSTHSPTLTLDRRLKTSASIILSPPLTLVYAKSLKSDR